MNIHYVRKVLADLYKIVEAGEKGYAAVASNVSNRALKVLFKSHVQQRVNFKEEILAEIRRLGGDAEPGSSVLGMIHRGRIDIFATLTIGAENVEKVLLKEVMLGEGVAIRAYENTLKKELPPETRSMLERQFEDLRKVVDQVRLLRGQNGKRLVLRLFDSRSDAEQALQSLKRAGIAENTIKLEDFNSPALDAYKDRGTTISETVLSGAVGGAMWGTVAGLLAAVGIMRIAALNQEGVSLTILIVAFLGLIAAGSFIGGMIGLFIGWSVSSQDTYVSDAVQNGEMLVRTVTDESLASKAWRIMNQVAMESKARHTSGSVA
ncbi:MAG: PA2169 family four-helix-bundle protein [Chloroflexota bacterium]|nr:PA2169 family four-helix-bundle protein [Chloroflexota bacterium]